MKSKLNLILTVLAFAFATIAAVTPLLAKSHVEVEGIDVRIVQQLDDEALERNRALATLDGGYEDPAEHYGAPFNYQIVRLALYHDAPGKIIFPEEGEPGFSENYDAIYVKPVGEASLFGVFPFPTQAQTLLLIARGAAGGLLVLAGGLLVFVALQEKKSVNAGNLGSSAPAAM